MFDPLESPKTYNLVNPPRLDTTTVYPSAHGTPRGGTFSKGTFRAPCGWIALRFTAVVPGMHLFHCHIDWHMVMGMGMVFDIASEAAGVPPADYELCGNVNPRAFSTIDARKRGDTHSSGTFTDTKNAVLIASTLCLAALTSFFFGLWWKAMQARDRALAALSKKGKQLAAAGKDTIPLSTVASFMPVKSTAIEMTVRNPIQDENP